MSELTTTEQRILQAYRNKGASAISAVELVKELGGDAGAIGGLMQKGYVQRQSVNGKIHYVLIKEVDLPAEPRRAVWKAKPDRGSAIDRYLRRWGTCTIQADVYR